MEPTRRLDDDALAEEIEMYGDLVVAASESERALPTEEIDRVLGVPPATGPRPTRRDGAAPDDADGVL